MRPWIDTGHMNADSGATSGSTTEVSRNDIVADFVEAICVRQGWATGYTNEADPNTTLSERVSNAHAFNADTLVSIHHDWTGGRQAVIYPNNHDISTSRRLALAISSRIDPLAPTASIVYSDVRNLTILRTSRIPAVIVECARVQDPYEAQKLAESIVRGMCEYYYVPFKEEAMDEPEYKIMAISMKTSDLALEKKLIALGAEAGKAVFETKEAATLPTWTSGWYKKYPR